MESLQKLGALGKFSPQRYQQCHTKIISCDELIPRVRLTMMIATIYGCL